MQSERLREIALQGRREIVADFRPPYENEAERLGAAQEMLQRRELRSP
jgi:hypothetical protein